MLVSISDLEHSEQKLQPKMTFRPKTNKSFIHQTFGKQPIWTLAEVFLISRSDILIRAK